MSNQEKDPVLPEQEAAEKKERKREKRRAFVGKIPAFCVGAVVGGIATMAIVVSLLGIGAFLPKQNYSEEQIVVELQKKIEASEELTVTKVKYTDAQVVSNDRKVSTPISEFHFPFTEDETIVLFGVTVGLGFNLSDIGYEADAESKVIRVTLPELQPLYKEFEITETYKIKDSIFTVQEFDVTKKFEEEKKQQMAERALADEDVLPQAQINAQNAISSMILSLPVSEGYSVEFVTAE